MFHELCRAKSRDSIISEEKGVPKRGVGCESFRLPAEGAPYHQAKPAHPRVQLVGHEDLSDLSASLRRGVSYVVTLYTADLLAVLAGESVA